MWEFLKEWALVLGIVMIFFSSLFITAAFILWVVRFFRRHAHDIFCRRCNCISYVKKGKKDEFGFYDVYIVCLNKTCGEYKRPVFLTCRDVNFDGALSFGYKPKLPFKVDAFREKLFKIGKACAHFLSPFS